jgi:hypothetical protein
MLRWQERRPAPLERALAKTLMATANRTPSRVRKAAAKGLAKAPTPRKGAPSRPGLVVLPPARQVARRVRRVLPKDRVAVRRVKLAARIVVKPSCAASTNRWASSTDAFAPSSK